MSLGQKPTPASTHTLTQHPHFKNRQIHFRKDLIFLLVAAWQPASMLRRHDSDVRVCGNKTTCKTMFLDVALFLIPHPPPLHQLATCSEAVLLCTRQGRSPAKTGWIWHPGICSDSPRAMVDNISLGVKTGWHQFQSKTKSIVISHPLLLLRTR